MSTQAMSEPKQKWYQQRWLLFVMSVPAASVILSSIMIYHAVTGKDSLVNDNYYKYGMEINQTIGQDKLAKTLSVEATVTIKPNGDAIIKLESLAEEIEPFLTLKLVHPTLGNLDSETKLFPSPSGYTAQVPENLTGLWYLDLYSHDESWRIRRQTSLPTSTFLMAP